MVSVLNKELEYEEEKHKYKKLKIIQPRINFQLVNKPSRISPHEDLQFSLIKTIYHLLLKNN